MQEGSASADSSTLSDHLSKKVTFTETPNLKKLGRRELLELLVKQSQQLDALEDELKTAKQQLAEAHQKLEDRTLAIQNAGSLAEASLALSGVFDATQRACDLYWENILRLSREEDALHGED